MRKWLFLESRCTFRTFSKWTFQRGRIKIASLIMPFLLSRARTSGTNIRLWIRHRKTIKNCSHAHVTCFPLNCTGEKLSYCNWSRLTVYEWRLQGRSPKCHALILMKLGTLVEHWKILHTYFFSCCYSCLEKLIYFQLCALSVSTTLCLALDAWKLVDF